MRTRSALVIAALVALSLAPLASPVGLPANGGASFLYLRSLAAPLPGVGPVLTLSDEAPVSGNATTQNINETGTSWYALPGAQRELALNGSVRGVGTFQVAGATVPIAGATFSGALSFGLLKVATNGTATEVANTSVPLGPLVISPLQPVSNTTNVSFDLTPSGVRFLAGETLGLRVSGNASGVGPLSGSITGTIQLVYDSTGFPGGLNLTLDTVARGSLQVTTATLAKEAANSTSATYTVTVRNTGDQADTARFNATGSPADWLLRLTPNPMALSAGAASSLLVTVTVPASAAEGTRHNTTLTVTSDNGAAPQTLTLVTTVRAGAIGITPGGTPGDTDGDGWSDRDEVKYSSDPRSALSTPVNTDSDGDGISNRDEVDAGTDPFSAGGNGGARPASAGLFGPLTDSMAQALGTDRATADIALVGIILLFLLILLLLVLLLRGYPVKVLLTEPRATTEPGRAVDYTVEIRSLRRQPQIVDLEVSELPSDWDARLSQPRVSLEPKAREAVGLLVRPPDGWPAPSKREFQVRARSRLKPGKFAKALGKLTINPAGPGPEPPGETGVPEPPAFPEEPPAQAYAPPPPTAATRGAAPFRVAISQVKHNPDVPERGGEVTTTARIDNQGGASEKVRLLLVVNGKVRDEVNAELGPGEGAEAEFHWVAYLARNEVRVVAERS